MEISIIDNLIILSYVESLKKYQYSQLEYYGYKRTNNIYTKESSDIINDCIKIIEYLENEDVSISLSDNLVRLLEISLNKGNEQKKLFDRARQIKEGYLINDDFKDFTSFIERLPRKLKPHQVKSAYHFYTLKNAANFSVPGSGKTSTVLSVYERLRLEKECNVLFIVGPPSCFQPWKVEFQETLGRIPKSIILSGGSKLARRSEYYRSIDNTYELYLCTFQTALNDADYIEKFLSQIGIKAFFIIDEAHYIKQQGGSWATSLLKIGKQAFFKGVLTGTPIPKSYKDIFNLFDFLWDNNSPLTQNDKIQINIWEKTQRHENIIELLDEKVGPLFYRVRKKDLGLTLPNYHPPIIVKMQPIELDIYKYVTAKIFDLSQNDYFSNEDTLNKLWKGRIMRIRQAASYPKLLFSAIEGYSERIIEDSHLKKMIRDYGNTEIPGKLKVLNDLVLNLRRQKQKVLIWSNFIGTLEVIKNHFLSKGEKCELIYGKTPIRRDEDKTLKEERTREDIRDEFVDPESGLDILIANPAACAESISLHKTCFHAIYYDLSYNCAQYIQSLDRIHRVGGSELNIANYYFLQYENSIDQDIKENLEMKAQKMYNLIDQDYKIYDLDLYEESIEDDIEAYKRLFIK
ncbi:MAG: DEAD/DEAH box helicase [Prevotella sp.]|jgi:SNF2 family DNA or RNA helicase|nr:DEAD/DEAH box helicase [Prevotella sp.]